MVQLKSVSLKREAVKEGFPMSIPAVRTLETLRFPQPITFFVGENGSGKSTLLEALAAGAGLATVGGEELQHASDMAPARRLADHLRFEWAKRTRRGFFLRAEDFFNFAGRIRAVRKELVEQADAYERELEDRPFAAGLVYAIGGIRGEAAQLDSRYGSDLHAVSHGESFLKLFQSRIAPNGLYLLDEPEAPLSPLRQLAFLSLLKQGAEMGSQFIIATHSPLLMAYPGATIYCFDDPPVHEAGYDELEHVNLTRDFLNNPGAFLKRL